MNLSLFQRAKWALFVIIFVIVLQQNMFPLVQLIVSWTLLSIELDSELMEYFSSCV